MDDYDAYLDDESGKWIPTETMTDPLRAAAQAVVDSAEARIYLGEVSVPTEAIAALRAALAANTDPLTPLYRNDEVEVIDPRDGGRNDR